ncbi:MAG: hypothetical protein M3464_01770 [Chloroflexota bacterium]|nr:hypothetical protein [Chloroflexota bacterium]
MVGIRPLASTRATWPDRFRSVLIIGLLLALLATGCGAPAAGNVSGPADSAIEAAGPHRDDSSPAPTALGDNAQTTLQTVGGTAPELATATGETWRSQAGSLLAAESSAWRGLTRQERRVLLDDGVEWAAHDNLIATNPDLPAITFPVGYFAAELRPDDEIRTDDLDLNTIVLALPAAKLGPALAEGDTQAVIIGSNVIILIDDVVVGRIAGGAALGIDAPAGTVDELGRIVLAEPGTGIPKASSAPTVAPAAAAAPLRIAASGAPLDRVPLAALPAEALDTIALIQAGGPFPFERDGVTFGNYEEHLPEAPFGSYREYTVITPGLDHRGARRIVAGDDGAVLYYQGLFILGEQG